MKPAPPVTTMSGLIAGPLLSSGPLALHELAVESFETTDHRLEGELCAPALPSPGAHRLGACRVGEGLVDCCCKCIGIPPRHQQPVNALLDQIRHPANCR